MRLIDADSALKGLERFAKECDSLQRQDTAWGTIEIIEKEPTVDPVKHGHWIDEGGNFRVFVCSECENKVHLPMNYCPCCGSKMDGEGNENPTL